MCLFTNFTALGGFFILLTSVISAGFNVFNACNASSSTGTACARSLEHSSS